MSWPWALAAGVAAQAIITFAVAKFVERARKREALLAEAEIPSVPPPDPTFAVVGAVEVEERHPGIWTLTFSGQMRIVNRGLVKSVGYEGNPTTWPETPLLHLWAIGEETKG